MKKKLAIILSIIIAMSTIMVGCGSSIRDHYKKKKLVIYKHHKSTSTSIANKNEKEGILDGKTLEIYCEASLSEAFQEIANEFKNETACDIEVSYGNYGMLKSKLERMKYGDLFITGSTQALNSIRSKVTKNKNLVRQTPVLAVKKGNPKNIVNFRNLTRKNVDILIGDTDTTSIGKVTKESFKDKRIFKRVNIIAKAFEASELSKALASGIGDATIVWKQNIDTKKLEIVDIKDLDIYIQNVSASTLKISENSQSVREFMKFLDSQKVKAIWKKYGYESIEK